MATLQELFNQDLWGLQEMQREADDLQKKFEKIAAVFNENFKGVILKDKAGKEWHLYHVAGWSHKFSFELQAINKRCPGKVTKEEKQVYLSDFSLMTFTGEKLEDRQKKGE